MWSVVGATHAEECGNVLSTTYTNNFYKLQWYSLTVEYNTRLGLDVQVCNPLCLVYKSCQFNIVIYFECNNRDT